MTNFHHTIYIFCDHFSTTPSLYITLHKTIMLSIFSTTPTLYITLHRCPQNYNIKYIFYHTIAIFRSHTIISGIFTVAISFSHIIIRCIFHHTAGLAGQDGLRGDAGDPGDTGNPGQEGSTGQKGNRGPTGNDGPTGQQGQRGTKGSSGDEGECKIALQIWFLNIFKLCNIPPLRSLL